MALAFWADATSVWEKYLSRRVIKGFPDSFRVTMETMDGYLCNQLLTITPIPLKSWWFAQVVQTSVWKKKPISQHQSQSSY